MERAAKTLRRWKTSPIAFVTEAFGGPTLEPWQAEALRIIGERDRLSIRAGHGVGKTTFEAWCALWYLCTHYPCKVAIVANTEKQLTDAMWSELRSWVRRMPPDLAAEFDISSERVTLKTSPESFITARTAPPEKPEALQGLHSEHMLFIIDEASGVIDKFFEVSLGALSTPGAKSILCGNPTRSTGFFYDTHHGLRHRWATMRVNCEDVPRARGHIEDIIAKFGKDSNAYRVRVLGEFPNTEDDAVIPLHLCEAAVIRQVETTQFKPVWGLDVARFGDDQTALCKRRGNTVTEPIKCWRGKDTMQTAGLIVDEWRQTDERDRPSAILVDVIGLGAGVVDRLRELGLPCRGINVGEAASASDRYMRLRDEAWFKAREWLMAGDCKLPDDQALIAELTAPHYRIESSGKIKVESKDDLKKRGLNSPDLADAFILTLLGGLDRVPDEQIDRYRKTLYRRRGGSSSWSY